MSRKAEKVVCRASWCNSIFANFGRRSFSTPTPDFFNQEFVVVAAFCGGQFLRLIEQAMKPAKETELMDEDDNLSRNSRCSRPRSLFLTLGVCCVFPNNATLQN
jgi:hypothetical protein